MQNYFSFQNDPAKACLCDWHNCRNCESNYLKVMITGTRVLSFTFGQDRVEYDEHLEQHQNGTSQACAECSHHFGTAKALEEHLGKRHASELQFECRLCHQRFRTIGQRVTHVRRYVYGVQATPSIQRTLLGSPPPFCPAIKRAAMFLCLLFFILRMALLDVIIFLSLPPSCFPSSHFLPHALKAS